MTDQEPTVTERREDGFHGTSAASPPRSVTADVAAHAATIREALLHAKARSHSMTPELMMYKDAMEMYHSALAALAVLEQTAVEAERLSEVIDAMGFPGPHLREWRTVAVDWQERALAADARAAAAEQALREIIDRAENGRREGRAYDIREIARKVLGGAS